MSTLTDTIGETQSQCPLCKSSSWAHTPSESVFALIVRCTSCNFQQRRNSGVSFASQTVRPAAHPLNTELGFKHGQPGRRCLRFGWSPSGANGAIQTELWSGLEVELNCPELESISFCVKLKVVAPKDLHYINFHAQDRFVGGIECTADEESTFSANFPLSGIACGRRFTLDIEMVPKEGKFFDIKQTQYVLQTITCNQVT